MGTGSQAEQEDVRPGKNYDPHLPIELHSTVLSGIGEEGGIFAGNTNHPPHGPVKQFSFLQPVLDNKVKKSR